MILRQDDRKMFNFDIADLEWGKFLDDWTKGCRQFVFKVWALIWCQNSFHIYISLNWFWIECNFQNSESFPDRNLSPAFLTPASDKTGSGGLSKYFWWQQCWANVFGDNNVDWLQSNLVQKMQMCTNFPVQQPLFAFPLIYFRLWSMSYWEAFSSRLFCNPGSGNSIKAYLFQDASSSCLVMQQQQQQRS